MTEIYNATEQQKEQLRSLIKDFLQQNNTSIYRLAKLLNERYGRSASVSNILNKMARGSFKVTEFMDIAELFGYELRFVKKEAIEGHEKNFL